MSSFKYCLDTHPLVWYFLGQKTLSSKAKEILDEIFFGEAACYIPSIVILEVFYFSLKKPKFIFKNFFQKLQIPNIVVVSFDKAVLVNCFRLAKNLDIHDRIICSTAITTKSVLITKDKEIQKLKSVKSTW